MSFNRDYIYDHLPARYRREDKDTFLKRFLTPVGEVMDGWDTAYDDFHASITPATAAANWIGFWLEQLFGWSWFPRWFTLTDKRRVYGNFARHLARRGTRRGIELFLKDFGIVARVHTRAQGWGEFVWGETAFTITQPLHLIVEILYVRGPRIDASFYGEGPWGEAFYSVPEDPITEDDIIRLIRYQQPHAQVIEVVWRFSGYEPVDYTPYWYQIAW